MIKCMLWGLNDDNLNKCDHLVERCDVAHVYVLHKQFLQACN